MSGSTRRQVLGASAAVALTQTALARTVTEERPWRPDEAYPPVAAVPGPLRFLTPDEAKAVDAIVARLIPADDLGPGAKEADCTVFIDRQLAGPYGGDEWLYKAGPYSSAPLPSQGLQTPLTPREQYRRGLAALDAYCKSTFAGKGFADLDAGQQDDLLKGLEKGDVKLPDFDGRMLFRVVLGNTMEGFFADPIYGGNRDMIGWKLVGFPGTRYDYRDVMDKPNQPYTLPPVGIGGRPDWNRKPT